MAAYPEPPPPVHAAEAAVLPLLAALAAAGRPLEASYAAGGWRVRLVVEPHAPRSPTTGRLGEMEENVVEALASGETLTGQQIADRTGYPLDKDLKACLASMRRRGALTGERGDVGYALDDPSAPADAARGLPFVPSAFQEAILDALEGKALRTDALGAAVGDKSRLFKPNGLKELQERGLVAHHSRLGFFRPDALPPQLQAEDSP